ncbi:hypothetical protein [Amycolatopsis sp. NPDC021455]|uniref:hypothetical protein n=1 Tax=Amycolatopsis sp. NPDC021455 TaxID=3154901 RepID=UPI0033E3AAFB
MDEGELLTWCVVANVLAETTHGEAGEDVQRGLKHFAPGAKVWVLPPQWGDGGESVVVVGRHRGRGSGRLARMVVGRHHLAEFRVRGVYSPAVFRELARPPADRGVRRWESEDEARKTAGYWNEVRAAVAGVRRPQARERVLETLTVIADPKPWHSLPHELNSLAGLFGDPAEAIGSLLRDEREAAAIEHLLALMRTGRPEVSTAAAAARALLSGTG